MISKLKLKFGSSPTKPPLELDTTPITVFVGPNNSGKSKILIEIEAFCRIGTQNTTDVIFDEISFTPISDPESEILKYTLTPRHNEAVTFGHIIFGKENHRHNLSRNDILLYLKETTQQRSPYCQFYVTFNTIRLDGKSRIGLINEQDAGDLQTLPQNNLQVLFSDNIKRNEVRRIIFDAFNKYFVVDPTKSGRLRIRLSDVAPIEEMQERGIHQDAVSFHSRALDINLASDGVKAFTGIITTIIAGEPKIILIDEPEAFLHPSLAFNLGKEISNSVKGSFKNLFVSTHSSNFLMGCIQSGTPLNIVRLTYSGNIATARILPSEKVLKLMRHPLLRSTGVLNGLFYESVIVTESDADRAFYQEINERLLAYLPANGIPNCLFLNAQNYQTIHEMMKPLREMGIPCAAIVDVDVLKNGGTTWTNLLSSAFIPGVTIESTATARSLIDEYGIFVVRNGELESWLKTLGATSGHSPEWLIEIFEKLGEDPQVPTYVKPMTGDVWDFISKIKTWFTNPNRKGIPE
jgi:predicted ATPase